MTKAKVAAGEGEEHDIQVASLSDGPRHVGSDSVSVVYDERAGRVYATQQIRLPPRQAHTWSSDLLVGGPMSGEGRAAESAEAKRRWVGTMTYRVSEEGPVCQIDLVKVGRSAAVAMDSRQEVCFGVVQAAEAAGAVNRAAGVEVLRNNGQMMTERALGWDDPWVSRRPEVLWRSVPALPQRGR